MITFKGLTHILIGLTIYSIFFEFDINIILFIILGSIFPDIDTHYSLLGKFNPFVPFMKHRGRTHTIYALILFSAIVGIYSYRSMLGFALGYLLHLIADTLTPMGIMWGYPFSYKYYSFSTKDNNLRYYEGLIALLCLLWILLGEGRGSIVYF